MYVPNHLKTQEQCDLEVHTEPYSLEFRPDRIKMQEMSNEAV